MPTAVQHESPWVVTVGAPDSPVQPRQRLVGSPQQEDFWEELLTGSSNVLLEARAGTGKSTSCREGMWRLLEQYPSRSIRYCCFNKKIADEFALNSPPGVDVGTMHSFGLAALRDAFRPNVDKFKTYLLLDATARGANLKRYIRKAIASVVSLAKNHALLPDQHSLYETLEELVDHYDIECWGKTGEVIGWVIDVLERSAEQTSVVDYDDMLWLTLVHPVRFPSVDDLFIDECLPSWTPVLLADGTSKTIGEIVNGKLAVDVLAFDTETGRQKPCRVTGWSRTLNRKRLVKIKVRWNRKKGTNRPTNFVICTEDHKVWADGRWVPAGDVVPGMAMQVETSAHKAQRGKITSRGRRVLAGAIAGRNDSGAMAHSPRGDERPPVRGGNGTGPTLAQAALFAALGDGWCMEHVVKTGLRSEGYPNCYKLDLADPERMIAVEVDGESHRGQRRSQDIRKDEFLRSRGWKVIRVSNREAIQDTEAVAKRINGSDCSIGAKVVSVEAISIPDSFVYDITVEGCHNFYANGILVHNCQDLNPVQHAMAELLCGSGRTVIVGDPYQSIYAFRGADSESIPKLKAKLDALTMPLTVTFRCPKSHVDLARELVSDFEAAPAAPEGVIHRGSKDLIDSARPGDLVLCRSNAPVIQACLRQIAKLTPAVVRGRAIGDQLTGVVRKIGDVPTIGDFTRELSRWKAKEFARLSAKDGTDDLIEQLSDRHACLEAIASACDSPSEIPSVIDRLFSDDDAANRVTFSSVHRAKGSEAHRVTYIQIPYSEKRDKDRPPQQWELDQRRNLRYVALTRSMDELTLVS